jgi:hypothetical protein
VGLYCFLTAHHTGDGPFCAKTFSHM